MDRLDVILMLLVACALAALGLLTRRGPEAAGDALELIALIVTILAAVAYIALVYRMHGGPDGHTEDD